MENETGKDPKALPDEALDEAAGGTVTFGGSLQGESASPGFQGGVSITDGTSNKAGFQGGVRVASGDVNSLTKAGPGTLNIADGSVKPGG